MCSDCGVPMSSSAVCIESWGVLGKALAISSKHMTGSSAMDKMVRSCMACLVGVCPLRLPYWCGDNEASSGCCMAFKINLAKITYSE